MNRLSHESDITKLPKVLQGLPWEKPKRDKVFDGDMYLAAVAVCDDSKDWNGPWHYCLSIIKINCDEDYFHVEAEDESWGWDFEEIDLLVKLE